MKVNERLIGQESEYFIYEPGAVALKTFFYPLCTGHFFYEPGYRLYRTSFDSFLLMYIRSGGLTLEYEGNKKNVKAGEFVLLDCYRPHAYYSDEGWESVWCHFDGPMARAYYELTTEQLGNVFTLSDSYTVERKMTEIYDIFRNSRPIREPVFSRILTDIWTELLLFGSGKAVAHSEGMDRVIAYIGEHFTEKISVKKLADEAMLSQYHFIRIFKQETGFTPHDYIVNTRIRAAKYMLRNTRLTVKDICYEAGFSSESSFCTAFKKKTGLTPAHYREVPTAEKAFF